LRQPRDGGRQIIDPQADVVERGLVDLGLGVGVDRLHQVELDRTELQDVLVDVLPLAAVAAEHRHAQQLDPQVAQGRLVGAADRNLLQAEHAKWSLLRHVGREHITVVWITHAAAPRASHPRYRSAAPSPCSSPCARSRPTPPPAPAAADSAESASPSYAPARRQSAYPPKMAACR